jgi:hypothetical protein
MERYGKRMEATKKAKTICLLPRSRCLQLLLQLPFFILFALACLERPTPNVSNYMAFVFGVNFFLSLFYLSAFSALSFTYQAQASNYLESQGFLWPLGPLCRTVSMVTTCGLIS